MIDQDTFTTLFTVRVAGMCAAAYIHSDVSPSAKRLVQIVEGELTMRDVAEVQAETDTAFDFCIVARKSGEDQT